MYILMERTHYHLTLDAALMRRLKVFAAQKGKAINLIVSKALERYLPKEKENGNV